MTQDKLKKLDKYLASLEDRVNSAIPLKHKNHPESYKRFLKNEIDTVKRQIADAKLEGVVEVKK